MKKFFFAPGAVERADATKRTDMGGTQPYIPVGADVMSSARVRRVVDLLAQQLSYKQVADATCLTESRVRHIERAWRREQIAARQGRLPLD